MWPKIVVLFVFSLFLMANLAIAECILSEDIDNFVIVPEGDFEIIFGTSGSVFELGETVRFELIVTNTSSSPVQINFPVHYPESIFVTDVSCPDVESCIYEFEYTYPPALLYVPGTLNFDPGECQQWTMEWDLAADPTPIGPYKVWGGLFAWTDGIENLPLGIWLLPAEGATVLIDLVDPVAADALSWGETKSLFR